MSPEENKATSRRVIEEIWNGGNLDLLEQLIVPNIWIHDPDNPRLDGRFDVFRQLHMMYRTAFPDLQFTIEDQLAEGDLVATRWTARGTHQGPIRGIPATGKEVTVSGMTLERYKEGKLFQSWINWDGLGLMQQLGVLPAFG